MDEQPVLRGPDSGAGLYACKASVDLFGLTKDDDFIPRVQDIVTVSEFCGLTAGGSIIST